MKQRNSYLDSVNAGRRRRAASDFEAISSTLSGLEAELDRLSRARNTRSSAARPPVAQRPQPQTHPVAGEAANTALLGRINREIESLRAEMRGARPVNLEREVTELRHQLGALQSTVERAAPHDMSGEFDRLYERLDHLPGGSQDHDQLSQLTAEMDELKRAVATLAREDSLRAVEDRWNQFDERWDAFQDTMLNRAGQPYDSQEILNLADRIYNLQELVASLPETLPIGSLEQQIGVLARAIERMATKDGRDLGEAFAAVEERLDELSRAVVSSSVSGQPPVAYDFSALDRIEGRIPADPDIEPLTGTSGQLKADDLFEVLPIAYDVAEPVRTYLEEHGGPLTFAVAVAADGVRVSVHFQGDEELQSTLGAALEAARGGGVVEELRERFGDLLKNMEIKKENDGLLVQVFAPMAALQQLMGPCALEGEEP